MAEVVASDQLGELNMSEAREVFDERKGEAHIQFEETRKFFELCQEGKAISGITEEEQIKLIEDLENDSVNYSNDMVIDMIIDYVIAITKEEKLLEILKNIKVGNIDDENIIGTSYPKYYDGSYYIEIGRKMERQIRLLSDVFAVLYMFNEKLSCIEYSILYKLLMVNLQRFNNDEEYTEDYNEVQSYMISYDNLLQSDFTDKYVAYAREIHEMAIAFFIGHEIGHHYYGHTEKQVDKIQEDSRIKEIKADSYGMEFAFEYLKSAYPCDEERYGIHQFAAVYIPLIVSMRFCEDILKDGAKHPSIIKRLLGVQKKLEKEIDKEGFEEVQKDISKLCEIIKIPNIVLS